MSLRRRSIALLSILLATAPALAADPLAKTLAELYKERAALTGQQVSLRGKVVKVNNRIMGRNWVHLQDGTGDAADGSNDITVTTEDTVKLNDEVRVVGTVAVDVDFGSGYRYPLLVEQGKFTGAQ